MRSAMGILCSRKQAGSGVPRHVKHHLTIAAQVPRAECVISRDEFDNATAAQRKNPHQLASVRVCFHQIKSLAVTYFHIDKVDTSIGAERFHFRVRKGIGWFPLAMAARQTVCKGAESWLSPFTNSRNLFRPLSITQDLSHSSLQLIPTYDSTLGKSLGCYMVKPH